MSNSASAVINGQLVPIVQASAIMPPPAGQPVISAGASPPTLATSTASGGDASSAAPNIAGVATDLTNLPAWRNPIYLVVGMLIVSYLILRVVHWHG